MKRAPRTRKHLAKTNKILQKRKQRNGAAKPIRARPKNPDRQNIKNYMDLIPDLIPPADYFSGVSRSGTLPLAFNTRHAHVNPVTINVLSRERGKTAYDAYYRL